MNKGKLIVVEGASDGIGKTTQFDLLRKALEKDGESLVYHHFPTYESMQGALVEKYLAGEFGSPSELSPYFVNSLYAVDRAVTWQTKLKQSIKEGKIVLLDRYTTSSLIYQSALIENIEEKKAFIDYVIDFEYNKLGIKRPDMVIFLHADYDLVTKMRNARKNNDGIVNDIHESNEEFLKKVYQSAMFIADYLAWEKVDCSKENQMRSIEDIQKEVYSLVRKKQFNLKLSETKL